MGILILLRTLSKSIIRGNKMMYLQAIGLSICLLLVLLLAAPLRSMFFGTNLKKDIKYIIIIWIIITFILIISLVIYSFMN